VLSQGEVLAAHLAHDGVVVHTTSGVVARAARALDIIRTVRSWRGQVDVVVVLGFSGAAFAMTHLGLHMARRLDVPVVLWLHGGNLPEFCRRHPRWVRAVLTSADHLIAPSPYLAALGPMVGRAIDIIPNVLPEVPHRAALERPDRARTQLLWMRTFHPLYRPTLAVEVLAGIRQSHPEVTLTMAGQDKGQLEATRRLVDRRGLHDAVRFAGFLDAAGKAQAFADHDVFLNTTSTDNAPVSLLEAAAHGLVIVSTPAGGITELFTDEVDALLAPDADGLATRVARVLDDPALAARLSGAGLAVAQTADWGHVGPLWHRLLDGCAGFDGVAGNG